MFHRLWPKSLDLWPRRLQGQVVLAIALALLLAQGLNAALLYRSQHERREATVLHTAALRLLAANRDSQNDNPPGNSPQASKPSASPGPPRDNAFFDRLPPELEDPDHRHPDQPPHDSRRMRLEQTVTSPLRPGEHRLSGEESDLRQILAEQDLQVDDIQVFRRAVSDDPRARQRLARMLAQHHDEAAPDHILIASVKPQGNPEWLTARVWVPPTDRPMLNTLIGQTLFIYAVLVGAMALLLRRITRPLALLTGRLARFADTRDMQGQLEPQGPEDIRRLIAAHNAMEARISALLDEKDVMLGAIGHDLKTPLAALRVRIESVEDEIERGRMAHTIEDITRSLDDILSLARVGRPSDPRETIELSALVASVVEEYEDMGDDVELGDTRRLALPLRPTWVRRGLRNLIGNALRYGHRARVSLTREEGEGAGDWAIIRIDDDGPGIPEGEIARMQEPFTRGDPSRNSETGGAGLGLTLARAIAEQHGGTLQLVNRRNGDGAIAGLSATLSLPVQVA